MNNILIALMIGLIAGVIDVIPMRIKKIDKFSSASAFFHWVVLGLIIPFVNWDIVPWLKGLIIGELSAIPIMLLVYKDDKKAVIPMAIFSAILGISVAVLGDRLVG